MFARVVKSHNNGRELKFIKPSACRMAGEAIQLMRCWRLKAPMDEAFGSSVYTALGREFVPLKECCRIEAFWDLWYACCQLLFPFYCILRIADVRIGQMDKVKYHVLQVDRLLDDLLDTTVEKWKAAPVIKISGLKELKFEKEKQSGQPKTEGLEGEYGVLIGRFGHELTSSFNLHSFRRGTGRRYR